MTHTRNTNSPIFIVGANRSGTTLLRLILNAHSQLAIPEEIIYFGSTMAGVPIEKWRNPGLSEPAYKAFISKFVDESCSVLDGIDQEGIKQEILESDARDFCHPYRTVLESWAQLHGKQRWGEKTPGNLFYADILLEMFPDARFIHIVRDPRAGVSSMMKTTFFPKDIAFNAMSRRKFMTKGREILEKAVPASQRLLLRYEDIVKAPEPTVQAICSFINVSFEPAMLSFYKDSSRYMKAEAANSFNSAATKPISEDMLDKWKKNLTPAEVSMIERVCYDQMRAFGYEMAGTGLSFRQYIELLVKEIYWKMQEQQHRKVRHFTVKSKMFARFKRRLSGGQKRRLTQTSGSSA